MTPSEALATLQNWLDSRRVMETRGATVRCSMCIEGSAVDVLDAVLRHVDQLNDNLTSVQKKCTEQELELRKQRNEVEDLESQVNSLSSLTKRSCKVAEKSKNQTQDAIGGMRTLIGMVHEERAAHEELLGVIEEVLERRPHSGACCTMFKGPFKVGDRVRSPRPGYGSVDGTVRELNYVSKRDPCRGSNWSYGIEWDDEPGEVWGHHGEELSGVAVVVTEESCVCDDLSKRMRAILKRNEP